MAPHRIHKNSSDARRIHAHRVNAHVLFTDEISLRKAPPSRASRRPDATSSNVYGDLRSLEPRLWLAWAPGAGVSNSGHRRRLALCETVALGVLTAVAIVRRALWASGTPSADSDITNVKRKRDGNGLGRFSAPILIPGRRNTSKPRCLWSTAIWVQTSVASTGAGYIRRCAHFCLSLSKKACGPLAEQTACNIWF